MQIVAFRGRGKMELDEAPDPTPKPGELVVAVAYCGICGSDLHEYVAHNRSPRALGMWQPVMGHELTGVVAAAGSDVRGVKEGDPIVIGPGDSCGGCFYCRQGRTNLCISPLGGVGYTKSGGYGQYVTIHPSQAVPLPDRSWLKPAALSEPFGVAIHAVNRGGLAKGERVFMAGAGPIGLLMLLAATHKGAGVTIVSEPAQARRELAQRLGADVVLDPAVDDTAAKVRELTDGLGADIAIDCVGKPPAFDSCFGALRRGGRLVVAGTFDVPHPVDLVATLIHEYTIVGTLGSVSELEEAAGLISSGAVDVGPVISSVVTLGQLPAVFAELTNDRNTHNKVLVCPNGEL